MIEETYQRIYQAQFSDVKLLDYSRFKLENHQFGDFEHLNAKGAAVYSRWFNEKN